VISGVDFIKDFAAGLTNFFGGRSGSYEGELIRAREDALREIEKRASVLGANAIVGVYLCQSEVDGVAKLYELKYLISDCRWELYKM
jgi:uncharacterized protein YbjQ (UPF0145 family)